MGPLKDGWWLRSVSKELAKAELFERMDEIASLYLKGENVPSIAKKLKLRVSDVESNLQEWRGYIRGNQSIQNKATESLYKVDAHLNEIVKEFWSVIEEAGETGQLSIKNVALKGAADTELKRVEMLAKAGLSDNDSMAELILENEQKIKQVVELLKELSSECAHCRNKIINELHRFSDKAEPVVIKVDDEEE